MVCTLAVQRSVQQRNVTLKAVLTTHKHWYGTTPQNSWLTCHIALRTLSNSFNEHPVSKVKKRCVCVCVNHGERCLFLSKGSLYSVLMSLANTDLWSSLLEIP